MIFYILNAISVLILSIIRYINADFISKLPDKQLLKNFFGAVLKYQFWIVISCAILIFLYSIVLKWLTPKKAKRKLIDNILERMNDELFQKNRELHRITLFKEIRYPNALVKHFLAFFYHIAYRKASLYFEFPTMGRYLGVYGRCGCQASKSTTMLRVELNDPQKCVGVAGYIRHKKMALEIPDLPDISNISSDELIQAKTVDGLKTTQRKDVKDYMRQGFINDFKILRKMHRRAKHFYGTIIQKRNNIWGVLLADSTSNVNPFTDDIKERFNSFAETISGIINMEV